MAENDQRSALIVQFAQVLGDGPHRDQRGALDVADGVLLWFANIDQPNGYAAS